MRKHCLILFLVFCFYGTSLFANDFSFGIKAFGLSIHPSGAPNNKLFPWKIDSKGIVVVNPCVTLNFEYFIWKDIISMKAVR
jgi:hypothetical protein